MDRSPAAIHNNQKDSMPHNAVDYSAIANPSSDSPYHQQQTHIHHHNHQQLHHLPHPQPHTYQQQQQQPHHLQSRASSSLLGPHQKQSKDDLSADSSSTPSSSNLSQSFMDPLPDATFASVQSAEVAAAGVSDMMMNSVPQKDHALYTTGAPAQVPDYATLSAQQSSSHAAQQTRQSTPTTRDAISDPNDYYVSVAQQQLQQMANDSSIQQLAVQSMRQHQHQQQQQISGSQPMSYHNQQQQQQQQQQQLPSIPPSSTPQPVQQQHLQSSVSSISQATSPQVQSVQRHHQGINMGHPPMAMVVQNNTSVEPNPKSSSQSTLHGLSQSQHSKSVQQQDPRHSLYSRHSAVRSIPDQQQQQQQQSVDTLSFHQHPQYQQFQIKKEFPSSQQHLQQIQHQHQQQMLPPPSHTGPSVIPLQASNASFQGMEIITGGPVQYSHMIQSGSNPPSNTHAPSVRHSMEGLTDPTSMDTVAAVAAAAAASLNSEIGAARIQSAHAMGQQSNIRYLANGQPTFIPQPLTQSQPRTQTLPPPAGDTITRKRKASDLGEFHQIALSRSASVTDRMNHARPDIATHVQQLPSTSHLQQQQQLQQASQILQQQQTQQLQQSLPSSSISSHSSRTGQQQQPLLDQAETDTTMEELASRLRKAEQGAQAEKTRQAFAMLWLRKNCELAEDAAVPRNRIYARYVDICTPHNIRPLNPASFGKLVRAAYPGIKTRRLGVRGQSKYHYCGFRLIGDQNNASGSTPTGTPRRFANSPDSIGTFKQSLDGTPFSQNGYGGSAFSTPSQNRMSRASSHSISEYDAARISDRGLDTLNPINLNGNLDFGLPELRFQDAHIDLNDFPPNQNSFTIPGIEKYLPLGSDRDVVMTLQGLYVAHCRSLIDSLRFMNIKKFLHCLSTFVSGLTSPVKKLLKMETIGLWAQKCDWAMYKEMVQIISPLALKEISSDVLDALRSLGQTLVSTLESSLSDMSERFISAKLRPAQAFTNVIDRLIRTNETGIQADKILKDVHEIRKMRNDWSRIDARSIVMREVPCGGLEVQRIIRDSVIKLLTESEHCALEDAQNINNNPNSDTKSRSNLYKWAQFLSALPSQFPNVSARLFLLCMSTLVTASLRQISLDGGTGFGAWWIVRCWIDEWMGWSAEMGGFLAVDEIREAVTFPEVSPTTTTSVGGNMSGATASTPLSVSSSSSSAAVVAAAAAAAAAVAAANVEASSMPASSLAENQSQDDGYRASTLIHGQKLIQSQKQQDDNSYQTCSQFAEINPDNSVSILNTEKTQPELQQKHSAENKQTSGLDKPEPSDLTYGANPHITGNGTNSSPHLETHPPPSGTESLTAVQHSAGPQMATGPSQQPGEEQNASSLMAAAAAAAVVAVAAGNRSSSNPTANFGDMDAGEQTIQQISAVLKSAVLDESVNQTGFIDVDNHQNPAVVVAAQQQQKQQQDAEAICSQHGSTSASTRNDGINSSDSNNHSSITNTEPNSGGVFSAGPTTADTDSTSMSVSNESGELKGDKDNGMQFDAYNLTAASINVQPTQQD